MNDLAHAERTAVGFSLAPRNLDEAFRLAEMLADSDLVPKDFRGKPGNVLIAVQWGFEVGLKPLQAVQNIAVINGRPTMWGDACLALVRASPLCEYVIETEDEKGTAVCRAKRRGEPEQTRTFSDQDAKVAGLLNKAGPWTTNPKRMKQMRARAFTLRDVFTDVLKGMQIAEEVMDIPTDTPPPPPPQTSRGNGNAPPTAPAVEPLTEAQLAEWRAASENGTSKSREFWEGAGRAFRMRATQQQRDEMWAFAVAADARTVDEHEKPQEAKPVDPANADFLAELEAEERRAADDLR
jgi:hypothetical protein